MMHRPTRGSRFAALQMIVLAILAIGAAAHPSLASEPAPSQPQARYEIKFLTDMIDHHHMAVMTAQLCQQKAIHPELHELCTEIEAVQMAEIELMQGWLQDWYGITHEPQLTPGMMRQMEKLASLSGAEFEIEFMTGMIRHHWTAIIAARQCQRRAYHPDLVQLCGEIAAAQTEEIALMQDWLCDWYDICHYGPKATHSH